MSITDPPNGSTLPVSPAKTYTKLDPFKAPTAEEILKREEERQTKETRAALAIQGSISR
jgi:hypothetical protein